MSKKVKFSGRVQGVGFRFTTKRLSEDHQVTGYVKNLPDGSVELVAEGSRKEVDSFLENIQNTMERNIQSVEVGESEDTGNYSAFQIKY